MSTELLAQAGGAVGAAGLSVLVLGSARYARLAGLGALALGLGLLLPLLAPSGHTLLLTGAAVLGLLLAAPLALLFRRRPWALAFFALGAAPVRIPVTVGETSANLLVPLYAVLAGSALALAWSLWRDERRARELGPIAWPLALLVLWLGLSGLWTDDVRDAAVTLFFFILPFGLLAVAIARLPWSPRALPWLFGVLAALAVAFAAVGVWQWLTRDVFWNPKVIVGNSYAPFYRVNSVFWDPSIYGRFLVVAILASLALLLFRALRSPRWELAIGAFIAALWVGLFFSFSQSSFAALAIGVVLGAVLAWRWRAAAAVAVVAAVMIPVGVAAPQLENVRDNLVNSSSTRADRVTSGRLKLVVNGVRIAQDHPLAGVGVGSFKAAYADRLNLKGAPPRAASHNTVVTVAAETGIIGLALFAWLVASGFLVSFRRHLGAAGAREQTAIVAGLGFAAIFAHSLFYNAFFEDPLAWGLLGLAALAAGARKEVPPPHPLTPKDHPPPHPLTPRTGS